MQALIPPGTVRGVATLIAQIEQGAAADFLTINDDAVKVRMRRKYLASHGTAASADIDDATSGTEAVGILHRQQCAADGMSENANEARLTGGDGVQERAPAVVTLLAGEHAEVPHRQRMTRTQGCGHTRVRDPTVLVDTEVARDASWEGAFAHPPCMRFLTGASRPACIPYRRGTFVADARTPRWRRHAGRKPLVHRME
jgi:hypothetical protein